MLNAKSLRNKYAKIQQNTSHLTTNSTTSSLSKSTSGFMSSSNSKIYSDVDTTTDFSSEGTVFPYSMVKDSLEQHPIYNFFKADLFETYKCMSNMLSSLLKSQKQEPQNTSIIPMRLKTNHICQNCSSICFVDKTHAEITCTKCGLVAQCQFSLHEDYERQKDLKNTEYTTASTPNTSFPSSSDCKNPEHWIEVDEMIEHCNPYVNLSYDNLQLAKIYQRIITIRSNTLSKAFAAIAMVQLKDRVDWSYVTRAVEMKAPVPQVSIMKFKKPQYSCLKCGAPVEEVYMTRRHPCKWGITKKKIRRSVWNS